MKKNEQVLEAWLQMTTVINNERITPDLPYNESMICRYLYQNQDLNVTATDLCNYMRMQKSQMNRTLTSMEKKKLITRIRSEKDTRKIYITLNDSMIRIYKKQHEKILKIVDELFDKIGYERQPEVIELFDLITQTRQKKCCKDKLDPQLFLLFHKAFFFDRIKMAFGGGLYEKNNYVKDVLVVLLGNFMVAVSVAFFVLPNNTLTGGVAGVAVALKPLLPFIPSVWIDQHIDDWTLYCGSRFFRKGIRIEIINFNI